MSPAHGSGIGLGAYSPPWSGVGGVLFEAGDSRMVGLNSTVPANPGDGARYYIRAALPLAEHVGAVTDPRGFDHEGHSGWEYSTLLASCEAAGALSPTPNRCVVWCGINDIRVPREPATVRADALAVFNALLDDASAPRVLSVRETLLGLQAGLSQTLRRAVDARVRGFRAWQLNRLREIYAGNSRFSVVDPGWVFADLDVDELHPTDAGHAKCGAAVVAKLRSHPGVVAPTKTAQQAALAAARGSHLKHAFDGRDTPTESGSYVSAAAFFVGGRTMSQAAAGRRPRWTGSGLEFFMGDDDASPDMMEVSGGIFPVADAADPYTLCWVQNLFAAPSLGYPSAVFNLVWFGGGAGNHWAIAQQTDTHQRLSVGNGAGYRSFKAAHAYTKDAETVAWSFAGGDVEDPANYGCRVNGTDKTVTVNAALVATPLVEPSAVGGADYGGYVGDAMFGTIECVLSDDEGAAAIADLEAFAAQVIA